MILQNKYSKWTVLYPVYAIQDVEIHNCVDDKWKSTWICEMIIIYILQMNNEITFSHPCAYDLFLMSWKLLITIILFKFFSLTDYSWDLDAFSKNQ